MLTLLLALLPANAGGYYYSDSGVVAAGRAGAWVAGADTQFAQYYNPAGLIRVDAPSFSAGLSGVQQNVRFDRVDDAGNLLPAARNQAPPFSVPQLGFATPINDKLGVAFGFNSPFAPSSQYDKEGAQRYSIIETTIWQFAIGGSVAYRPVPWLTVGGSVGGQSLRIDEQLKVTITGPDNDGVDDPEGDVLVEARTWDELKPWWNLGVLIEPHERVTIGLSMTPPVRFVSRGPGLLDFSGNFLEDQLDQSVWNDEDVALNVSLPVILRGGVAVRPDPAAELELAVVWEPWSSLSDIEVEDIDVTVTGPLVGSREVPEKLSLPSDFRNNVSVRLGGEWRVHRQVEVRAGAMWERGALFPQNLSLALVDPWKVQTSLGASAWLIDGRLRIDGMSSALFFPRLEIDDSTVTQTVIPITASVPDPAVVGNGTVRSNGWTAGVRLAWVFTSKTRETLHGTTREP